MNEVLWAAQVLLALAFLGAGYDQAVLYDDAGRRMAWVAALPERQRLAVFLRYYADLDYRAIATALAIEPGTVSATLNSAHASLRRFASTREEVSQ